MSRIFLSRRRATAKYVIKGSTKNDTRTRARVMGATDIEISLIVGVQKKITLVNTKHQDLSMTVEGVLV